MKKIETTRLMLREPLEKDSIILGSLWQNEIVRAFLGGILSKEQVLEKIEQLQLHWKDHNFGLWVVCDKNTMQIMGLCGPHYSDDGVEISYMFLPEFWRKGFATEALIASVDYCFSTLDIELLIVITQKANISSCSLLEKARFKHIKDFERFNALQSMYGLTKAEW